MQDHEIRDVMNRQKHPQIAVDASTLIYAHPNKDGNSGRLTFRIDNQSDVFARYVVLAALVPIRITGKLVSFGTNIAMQDSASGAAYKLVFSNHSEAPLSAECVASLVRI